MNNECDTKEGLRLEVRDITNSHKVFTAHGKVRMVLIHTCLGHGGTKPKEGKKTA